MVCEETRMKAVETVLVMMVLGNTSICLVHNVFMDS